MAEKRDTAEELELMQSLVGRTIVRARFFDSHPDADWGHHEDCWLWLDDGRVVEFSSYGYDADGATVGVIEVADVQECAHCGQPHPDSQVSTLKEGDYAERYGLKVGARYTWCDDGRHVARELAPAPSGATEVGE